jgi:hypothetical protein
MRMPVTGLMMIFLMGKYGLKAEGREDWLPEMIPTTRKQADARKEVDAASKKAEADKTLADAAVEKAKNRWPMLKRRLPLRKVRRMADAQEKAEEKAFGWCGGLLEVHGCWLPGRRLSLRRRPWLMLTRILWPILRRRPWLMRRTVRCFWLPGRWLMRMLWRWLWLPPRLTLDLAPDLAPDLTPDLVDCVSFWANIPGYVECKRSEPNN